MPLLAMLLIASSVLALRAARPDRVGEVVLSPIWQPNEWYQLDGRQSISLCELPAGVRYRLVIGCLGDSAEEYAVRVQLSYSRHRVHLGGSHALALHQPNNLSTSSTRERGGSRNADERESPMHDRWRRDHNLSRLNPAPCSWRTESEQPIGSTRDFFLHVTDGDFGDPKQYARITARNVACGQRVRVFLDQQLPDGEVSSSRIEELLQTLEADVLPRIESQFGPLQDVDQDGRLAVVLTPWLSRLQGGRTSIGGMVRSSDFRVDVPAPLGNRGDMLFLNSALPSDDSLRDLLSHEVAHAACISQRLTHRGDRVAEEEDWLSEALAHMAEPGWSNLDQRLATFLEEPSRYPLVVPDYYRAGLWRNPGCRGATYLFTRWCVERYGSTLIRQLVDSPTSGTHNLEQATGQSFDELFREWSVSLASGDALASSDLHVVLARLDSQGLKPVEFDADEDHEQTLRVRGTALTVVEFRVSSSESRILKIVGTPTARWQFSICQLRDDLPKRSVAEAYEFLVDEFHERQSP
jgi:hypothetical protein